MTIDDLIDEPLPIFERPDAPTNAAALRRMAEGIHYDDTPGEIAGGFAFLFVKPRVEAPAPVYRWQRSLPGIRVRPNRHPRPRPRKTTPTPTPKPASTPTRELAGVA